MTDDFEGEFGRLEILDYTAFGRLIADWAMDRKPWPESLEEFKSIVEPDIARVPPRMKAIHVVQPNQEIFYLRLPPKKMITRSLERFAERDKKGSGPRYQVPPFYADMVCGDEALTHTDFFLSRVADYTISICM
ncbi:hypothetical protein [Minwuia thermotolerans]|jgi:hypothetical protein|uniref:Uncharacterized protein n=1 Tax=Minwuia thermotolerans TaxID=2056226 RepID=A0A2M9G7L3_9PROT|nr:hypothetical protein [Minwuia thermotolerans]ANK80052.1 MAG: hypothetical protein TEF_04050 [Rhizobiales bacterium NRL2]PJK31695.1 hypothetical protein CVT23_01210 [Minwuia thermotolerans]